MRTIRLGVLIVVAVAQLAMCARSEAQLTAAYVDWVSGIIISRGQAKFTPNESAETVRARALQDARDNLAPFIERLNIDPSQTIGDFLSGHPEKRSLLTNFINTAKVINQGEIKEDTFKITISLSVDGAGGLKTFINQLKGIAPAPETTPELSAEESAAASRVISGRSPEAIAKPYRVALFDFINASSFNNTQIGAIYANRLKEQFKKDRRFIFLTSRESEGLLVSNGKTLEDLVDSKINDDVPLEGVDGVVIGRIVKYEPEINKHGLGGTGYLEMTVYLSVEIRILDARTGRWVYYDTIPVEMKDRAFTMKNADDAERFIMLDDVNSDRGLAGRAFLSSITGAERAVRTSFPLEGYVLKTLGDRVYINLTKLDGLHENDELNVYRVGEILTDPTTGKNLGRVKDRIAVLRVTESGDTYTQTIIKEMLGDAVVAGDVVTLK